MAPSPEFLFDIGGGPLFDIGPYCLTALVHVFGPVRRVSATSSRSHATRVSASGYRCCDSMLWLELWLVSVDEDDLT